ncbi:MAG: formyltransferase [Proteobacteria bacterium]|nr:formyltransferase [Pseudomonadota bacterium]
MRVVVFGYHEIGYVCLDELIKFGVETLCLVTHEDAPGEEIWFRKPTAIAKQYNIPVYTPETLDNTWIELIKSLSPDIIFSFYYRNMIRKEILDIPKIGAFNLHGSLLPKFRGRCPVNWVLIAGEKRTGVTLHYMVEKPDAGDIVAQKACEITFDDTAYTTFKKMADAARLLMQEVLPQFRDGTFKGVPQTGTSSYFGGRKPEDGLISWNNDALSIYNLSRAVTHPYPGAFTYLDGKKLYVWQAYPEATKVNAEPGKIISEKPLTVNTGNGILKMLRVQMEGEEEMDSEQFVRVHDLENIILGGSF